VCVLCVEHTHVHVCMCTYPYMRVGVCMCVCVCIYSALNLCVCTLLVRAGEIQGMQRGAYRMEWEREGGGHVFIDCFYEKQTE